ncbi:methyltransferase domain-containing protein [Patescibacteria group bacterium]|nr:methyltransferase domain-containing protein [Patescibacteria group bacterium]
MKNKTQKSKCSLLQKDKLIKKPVLQSKFNKNYYFGNIYSNYDEFLNWKEVAKDLIKRFKFNSFLDIGCGCGNLVKEIKKQKGKSADVYGIDASDFAVKKANISFVILADCQNLPFKDNYFDVVFILTTYSYLYSISDVRQAIREAYRVSRRIIIFEDVYDIPDKTSDNYDSCRQQFFSRKQWASFWKTFTKSDRIEICKYIGQGRFYNTIEIHKKYNNKKYET